MNIDENVPIIVPKSIVRVNHDMLSGPSTSIHRRTNARVRLVYILRVMDSDIDISMISLRSFDFHPNSLRLLRILSNITIVSLIEYHKIVSRAVIKNVSI